MEIHDIQKKNIVIKATETEKKSLSESRDVKIEIVPEYQKLYKGGKIIG